MERSIPVGIVAYFLCWILDLVGVLAPTLSLALIVLKLVILILGVVIIVHGVGLATFRLR